MKLFWRIFLGFWLAIAFLLAIVFSTAEPWLMNHLSGSPDQRVVSSLAFQDAVTLYEQDGVEAFESESHKLLGREQNILLFGADGRLLAPLRSRGTPWAPLAAEVLRTQAVTLRRINARVGFAFVQKSASGQTYAVVITAPEPSQPRLYRKPFWIKLALAMLPATLICLGLSLYITRPLVKLSATAKLLAEGDLTARPPEAQKRRGDEVGTLSIEIDAMASRIDELVTGQRRFVASTAHELGAPLTRMQLAIALLGRTSAFEGTAPLDQIEREADKLSHLVQDLLYLASLERGPVPPETFEPVALAMLCQQIVLDNAAEAEEGRCTILPAFEAITFRGAPQALRRAIENVLRNAIRHSPPDSVVQFSCDTTQSPDFATVTVRDSGPGVAEEMLTLIFEPFMRATPRDAEGNGLGLAIAAEAVSLHRGTMWAENQPLGGLVVNMRLPLSATVSATSQTNT